MMTTSSTKQTRFVIVLLLFGWALVGCAVDPRNQAEADATRLQAESRAARSAQELAQEQERFQIDQAERLNVSENMTRAKAVLIWASVPMLVIMLAGLAMGFAWAAVDIGRAVGRGAWVRANLVAVDRYTRQLPGVYYQGRGIVTLSDPNTGLVLPLDTRLEADRAMLQQAGAVRLVGTLAEASRQHKTKPGGVALAGASSVELATRLLTVTEGANNDHE